MIFTRGGDIFFLNMKCPRNSYVDELRIQAATKKKKNCSDREMGGREAVVVEFLKVGREVFQKILHKNPKVSPPWGRIKHPLKKKTFFFLQLLKER